MSATIERDVMEYDLVIVGGGPAGLAAAIQAKQQALKHGEDISVCVLEKSSTLGGHTLSGAVIDIRALEELFPDWQRRGAPVSIRVEQDEFWFLSANKQYHVPEWLLPNCFKNLGCYVVRLSEVVQWMGVQAEQLGVEIYPGFAAAHIAYDASGKVKGVITADAGIEKNGEPGPQFQPGMLLKGKYTLFAEGARGHLGKQLIQKFNLDHGKDPQSYALGIKEIWEINPAQHTSGYVLHTTGWPHDNQTYGGSFVYHLDKNQVALGLITGLDYKNPWISPFEEFQRFKKHPLISKLLKGGKRLGYGARAITAGGINSLPKLTFPGGALIGCEAGFLNAARIKGSHAAIKSGILAADAVFTALQEGRAQDEINQYPEEFLRSWLFDELYQARNFKSWFKYGRILGSIMNGIEQKLLKGRFPWTLHRTQSDHEQLRPANQYAPINYPKPDGIISFDRLSSVYLTATEHNPNQPCHLQLKNKKLPIEVNLKIYAGPESRYCPAGVYEFIADPSANSNGQQQLQINATNCIHCKTCDIKDPQQNINWVTPEGGGGPNYTGM